MKPQPNFKKRKHPRKGEKKKQRNKLSRNKLMKNYFPVFMWEKGLLSINRE
jgi:hypothetical protein